MLAEGSLAVDTDVGKRAAEIDRRAEFGRLAAAELSPSYQLAVRILGNARDAEDAVNEAVLRAWSSFDRLRDQSLFRPWLMRIVVNVCRNELRRGRSVRFVPLPENDDPPTADPFEQGMLRQSVGQALDCLDADLRVVVVLRYWNDLKVDEIARVVGAPSGTVKWRLHVAAGRMKAELERRGWEVAR
jgi:RNA polymerase sigma-70 factor (ECF subfamily)